MLRVPDPRASKELLGQVRLMAIGLSKGLKSAKDSNFPWKTQVGPELNSHHSPAAGWSRVVFAFSEASSSIARVATQPLGSGGGSFFLFLSRHC